MADGEEMLIQASDVIGNLLRTGVWLAQLIGMSLIFRKCGKKWWHAFIPFLNIYELSRIADREKTGRVMMVIDVLRNITISLLLYVPLDPDVTSEVAIILLLFVATIVLYIVYFVYSIRVFLGLTERFGRPKKWVIAWILAEAVTMLIWGISKKFQLLPDEEEKIEAAQESGIDAISTADNLSVNIRARTAKDFIYEKTLLKDIHLSIPKGHMVLLLGGSGAGKTTFLNAVTGYEKADADIEIGSSNVYRDYESMKYDIGFVPQLDLMRGNDTVYRTLADAAELRLPSSLSHEERKKRVDEVIGRFGLKSVQSNLVEKLSGGQRKRLSIAMEFISDPTLFILDEPDSGLDGVVARSLFESLRGIADSGKIVIVITHTPDRVIDLFDDVIVLAKDAERTGRLAYYGPVDEAYSFFGKEKIEQILLSINQKDEGGEGLADHFVEKYAELAKQRTEVAV